MDISAAGITSPAGLVFTAIAVTAFSGFPGLLLRRNPGVGQKIATFAIFVGCLLGLCGAVALILDGQTETFLLSWTLPFGHCEIAVDPLSAFFLLPVFLISPCAALYANGYWPALKNRATEPKLSAFFGLLSASMALVLTARNGVLFLMAWEVMALSAYFTLITEHDNGEVRKAGIVYLMATHTGTLALFVMFALLQSSTASFAFPAAKTLSASGPQAAVIFITAFIGFGVKAGIMPFHIWLPGAHANAPSHISAMMSGVMLKMGIYGIVRIVSMFHAPPLWWGVLLLIAGCASALLGIMFAFAQRDVKKLLAYSSIENIGIITTGVGLALIGLAGGNTILVTLGMAGALLHVLNHSCFKSLLFLGAGALIHATGTREIDRMGGLSRQMPATAIFFLIGCVAICGFPPLNGFVGEFFLYLGFFSEATSAAPILALGAPLLGLIGGFAAICFVKLYGIVFFGVSRCPGKAAAHNPGLPMLAPMGLLALICILAGLLPQVVMKLVYPALTGWSRPAPAALPSMEWLSWAGGALLLLMIIFGAFLRKRLTATPAAAGVTWDCGYLLPTARMQYTASSFADTAVTMFSAIIGPRSAKPALPGYFPSAAAFAMTVPETVLERLVMPTFRLTGELFSFLRIIQMGKIHIYVLYIFITLVLLLFWAH